MHPLTAAAIVDRLKYSTRIKSAMDAADDALIFTDSDARLGTPNPKVFFGWPELPMKRQEVYLLSDDSARLQGANEGELEEYSGGFRIVVFDPRALRAILVQEAIRRDLNKWGRFWPIPNDFGPGPTSVTLDVFKVTRIHGLDPPAPEDGYQTFRGAVSGAISERVEES